MDFRRLIRLILAALTLVGLVAGRCGQINAAERLNIILVYADDISARTADLRFIDLDQRQR